MSKSIRIHVLVHDEDESIQPVWYSDVIEAVKEFGEGEEGDLALLEVTKQVKAITSDINTYIHNIVAGLAKQPEDTAEDSNGLSEPEVL